jgi:hypothetical protein
MQSGIELNVTKTDQDASVITVTRKHETQTVTRTITLPLTTTPAFKRLRIETTELSGMFPKDKFCSVAYFDSSLHTRTWVRKYSFLNEYFSTRVDVASSSYTNLKAKPSPQVQLKSSACTGGLDGKPSVVA